MSCDHGNIFFKKYVLNNFECCYLDAEVHQFYATIRVDVGEFSNCPTKHILPFIAYVMFSYSD
jgi:hypothetical protein